MILSFDPPSPFKRAEEGVIWTEFSARMFEHVFYASSAAAVDIATDEGTLMLFIRDWLTGRLSFR